MSEFEIKITRRLKGTQMSQFESQVLVALVAADMSGVEIIVEGSNSAMINIVGLEKDFMTVFFHLMDNGKIRLNLRDDQAILASVGEAVLYARRWIRQWANNRYDSIRFKLGEWDEESRYQAPIDWSHETDGVG